jgi:hypothetical protein
MDIRRFWHIVGISWTGSQRTNLDRAAAAGFIDGDARRRRSDPPRPPFHDPGQTAVDAAFDLLIGVQWVPADLTRLRAAADAGMLSTRDGA